MSLPVRLTLSGSHLAAGVIVQDRESALALWAPGAVVHELDERVLVLFSEPRRLRAELTRGALVIARGGRLVTLELPPEVLGDAPAGALLEVQGGTLRVHPLDARTRRDPAAWIDSSGIELRSATPLGPEPAPARAPEPEVLDDARQALGAAIPARAEGAAAAAAAIARGGGRHALPPGSSLFGQLVAGLRSVFGRKATPSSGTALAPRGPSVFGRLRGWLATLLLGGRRAEPSSGSALAPRGPSVFDRLRGRFATLLLRSRFARHLGRRQAEYLARVIDLFDRGDIREALRWAIPLRGPGEEAPPTLALPRPRQDLALRSAGSEARAATLPVGDDLYALLGQQYRRVLAELIARGRVDEAAFVLVELLGDVAGALDLLERHGRFEQAARLAEARRIRADMQIRLWMLARDVPRAVRIARRHDAFPSAIALLRATHPRAADVLALEWADVLASAGDHAGAVDAAHVVPGSEGLVRTWLEYAIEAGGRTGARMLARRAVLAPERFDDTRERVLALLADAGPEREAERTELAKALVEARHEPAARALAAPVLRALWRDGGPPEARTLEGMVDAALRADRPPQSSAEPALGLMVRVAPKEFRVDAGDVGSLPVHDLALLPSGKLVVALGEAGLRILGRDGRNAGRIDAPADALAVSDPGTRAIAIARRGELHRLTRVDLIDRRAQPWWEARLASFARTFDGQHWLVSDAGTATLIDLFAEDWRAVARLEGEKCMHVEHHSGRSLTLITSDRAGGLTRWEYDATLSRLGQRSHLLLGELSPDDLVSLAFGPELWALGADPTEDGRIESRLVCPDAGRSWRFDGAPLRRTLGARGGPPNAVIATSTDTGVRVALVATDGRTLLRVELEGARTCCTRISADRLAIGDDRGRALVFELETGALLRDLRVRA